MIIPAEGFLDRNRSTTSSFCPTVKLFIKKKKKEMLDAGKKIWGGGGEPIILRMTS